ncbi:hypothetical protein [Archangium lansingense]|uniref:Lipoprotein n=1 Tax=Archangium lansingense TaxID=2995310 RepID=A0ABT4A4M2_9BACT|nr:hypothetical protein [Archangium lansinium]MCY1076204.1 hypothetical protein [Archangium lansinium]
MRHSLLEPFVLLASLLVTTVSAACPNCATSQVVKASVLGEGFWSYLVMLVVPFLLIGALSAILYRIGLPSPGMTSARARSGAEHQT